MKRKILNAMEVAEAAFFNGVPPVQRLGAYVALVIFMLAGWLS
tara:strand:- start:56 stop:184 length:129 start_codon:yes stop_codon:yes gene_type:complete